MSDTFTESVDCVVIGAGVVGLAVARALAQAGREVIILESADMIGTETSSRNSEVIHAGIYYSPGSQKANFCSAGGRLLRKFCDERGIGYEMCGKLIVAVNEEEIPRLDELFRRGTENGAEGLRMVDKEEIGEIEPYAAGVKAILSPNTGIIDFKEVSQAYATELGENGGDLITGVKVQSINRSDGKIYLETTSETVSAKNIVNCAGLHADAVAKMMGVNIGVRIVPFRGEYFSLVPEKSHMVKGLIYPVPDPSLPFLGVHFTRRVNGSVEAGPNAVLAFSREGYKKNNFNIVDTLGTLTYPGFWKMSAKYWKVGLSEQYRSAPPSWCPAVWPSGPV